MNNFNILVQSSVVSFDSILNVCKNFDCNRPCDFQFTRSAYVRSHCKNDCAEIEFILFTSLFSPNKIDSHNSVKNHEGC